MRGELSTGKEARRHPLDWYVEQGWEWSQVVQQIGLEVEVSEGCTIWDPAAGYGHSLSRLQMAGFEGNLVARASARRQNHSSHGFLSYE